MPSWLSSESFSSYPPQGRALALSHLAVFRQMPVALLPVFLVDLKNYDWKFPVEQQEIVRRIEFLKTNPSSIADFRSILVPPALDHPDKVRDPQRFLAEMTAYLWSSLQMDTYRKAADSFINLYQVAVLPPHPVLPRIVIVCIGRDARQSAAPLFQKLRGFGQVRTNVRAGDAPGAFLDILGQRALSHPVPYAHWYVDGGSPLRDSSAAGVTQLFYPALAPVNERILARIMSCIQAGSGPEVLQAELAELSQQAISADNVTGDLCLQHFALSLLTEGSGTQIFSTSFVQWAARELLRRAQPATVLVRFAPRQRQKAFSAMVKAASGNPDLDPNGSLIDADMGAYYTYLEVRRLPDAERAAFLVWFEDHSQVFVAGPNIPAGTTDDSPATMAQLISGMLSNA